MTEVIYRIGDLFEASFEILASLGMLPNIVLIIVGVIGLALCMKVSITDRNICE